MSRDQDLACGGVELGKVLTVGHSEKPLNFSHCPVTSLFGGSIITTEYVAISVNGE